MANPEHLEWLRQGVSSWNERRRRDPFNPDLSSEDISKKLGGHSPGDIPLISVDLGGINLSDADLRNATLQYTDLTGAQLHHAKLANAKLVGSDISGSFAMLAAFAAADLGRAKLNGAKFIRSDFSSALFAGADMKSALFWQCAFDGAHLCQADISAADFIQSRPWTARLFLPPNGAAIDTGLFEGEPIRRVNDLLDACRQINASHGDEATLYFRGESRCSWELRPSVMRAPDNGGAALRPAEAEMLDDLMTRQPDAFNGMDSALAQWVFAQHHGLKTRLLDVTRNPLVGLYTACIEHKHEDGRLHVFAVPRSLVKSFNSDAVRVILNFAKLPRGEQNLLLGKTQDDAHNDIFPPDATGDMSLEKSIASFSRAKARLCAIIRQENPSFEDKIDLRDFFRVFVVEPQRRFERVKAQSGAFLVSAFHERFERDEVLKWNRDVPIFAHRRLRVPESKKTSVLDELRLLNVTRESLFPSVDEAARAVTEKYLYRETNA